MDQIHTGTLAIDLGNTNTVIAFQGEKDDGSILIEIPNITTSPGVIPTAVWFEDDSKNALIGSGALRMRSLSNSEIYFHSNFKRLIGNSFEKQDEKLLSPMESG